MITHNKNEREFSVLIYVREEINSSTQILFKYIQSAISLILHISSGKMSLTT